MSFFRFVSIVIAGFLAVALPAGPAAAQPKSVKITAIVDHPALDACRQGAIEALAERGFVDGQTIAIEFQSAQADVGTAGQIARKFAGDRPDVVIAISTPSAQAVLSAVRGTAPIVFSAVSDPLSARLVKDLDHPSGNVTGVTDRLPLERHLELIREVLPGLRRLGVLFNPGEANSAAEVARLRDLASAQGITLIEGAAPDTNSVVSAARGLAGRVDAFYAPLDNTVVSALESVVKVSIDSKTPLFAGDTAWVARGAVASVGFDYHDIGRRTGQIAADILEGADPGAIPVRPIDRLRLVVNPDSAARMGLVLPEALLARAQEIVK
ncbi:MAG: ABC transporter substrate-binding protein [Rhodospirillaceae bacterium]|nr:ABC transporter substrate-binding protein [Rhodospirillaceae bacterium]